MGIESPVEMDSREKKGEGWEVVKTGLFRAVMLQKVGRNGVEAISLRGVKERIWFGLFCFVR